MTGLDEIINGKQSDDAKILHLQNFVEERLYYNDENGIAFDIPLVQAYNALSKVAAKKFNNEGGFSGDFDAGKNDENNAYHVFTEANCNGARHLAEIKYIMDTFPVTAYVDDSLNPEEPITLDYQGLRKEFLEVSSDNFGRAEHYLIENGVDLPYKTGKHSFRMDEEGRGQVVERLPLKNRKTE